MPRLRKPYAPKMQAFEPPNLGFLSWTQACHVVSLPTFIDVEASSLRSASYPIEVAWNMPDGTIEVHLISPAGIPRWTDWSTKAEQLHGISIATLLTSGTQPSLICRRMNRLLAGATVYTYCLPLQ